MDQFIFVSGCVVTRWESVLSSTGRPASAGRMAGAWSLNTGRALPWPLWESRTQSHCEFGIEPGLCFRAESWRGFACGLLILCRPCERRAESRGTQSHGRVRAAGAEGHFGTRSCIQVSLCVGRGTSLLTLQRHFGTRSCIQVSLVVAVVRDLFLPTLCACCAARCLFLPPSLPAGVLAR